MIILKGLSMKPMLIFIFILQLFCAKVIYSTDFKDIFIFQSELSLEENAEVTIGSISCIDIDSKGNFWISDWDNNQLIKFDKFGKSPRIIARKGNGPGEVMMPDEIYIDTSDRIFIANFTNRITEFNAEGKFIRSFQCTDGHFPTSDIAINSDGNIFIAGRKYSQKSFKGTMVHMYSPEGRYLKSFCEMDPLVNKRDLDMFNSACLTIDDQDHIYVSQPVTYRISVFNSKGDLLKTIGAKQFYYKEPKPLSRDIRTNQYKLKKYNQDFTYMAELFISNNLLIAVAIIVGGIDDDQNLYFIDFYDKANGKTILSGIKTVKRLRAVKHEQFYFLTTKENLDKGDIKNVIEIYKIKRFN